MDCWVAGPPWPAGWLDAASVACSPAGAGCLAAGIVRPAEGAAWLGAASLAAGAVGPAVREVAWLLTCDPPGTAWPFAGVTGCPAAGLAAARPAADAAPGAAGAPTVGGATLPCGAEAAASFPGGAGASAGPEAVLRPEDGAAEEGAASGGGTVILGMGMVGLRSASWISA